MKTQYQRGRCEALSDLGSHFAASADDCQRRICEAIKSGRDKDVSSILSEKIGHIKALSAVQAFETKELEN